MIVVLTLMRMLVLLKQNQLKISLALLSVFTKSGLTISVVAHTIRISLSQSSFIKKEIKISSLKGLGHLIVIQVI